VHVLGRVVRVLRPVVANEAYSYKLHVPENLGIECGLCPNQANRNGTDRTSTEGFKGSSSNDGENTKTIYMLPLVHLSKGTTCSKAP
jgi:hypothetical protein